MSQTKAQLIDNLVSPITGALGSAAAPTFSFTADPNTGLYSPGADQLALATGGTQHLYIGATGRVGINIADPQQSLHVSNSTTYEGIFVNGNAAPSVCFNIASSQTVKWRVGISGVNNNIFTISKAGNDDKLTVDENGNVAIDLTTLYVDAVNNRVGIGTSAPSAIGKVLNIYGGASEGSSIALEANNGSEFCTIFSGATAADPTSLFSKSGFKFAIATAKDATGFSEKMRLDSSGRLGIGVSAPEQLLHVSGSNSGANFVGQVISNIANPGSPGSSSELRLQLSSDGAAIGKYVGLRAIGTANFNNKVDLGIYTLNGTNDASISNTEKVRITGDGRVGIGTTSPTSKFDLVDAAADPVLSIRAGSTFSPLIYLEASGSNAAAIKYDRSTQALTFNNNSSSSERARIDSSGRLLVGTTSPPMGSPLLHVQGSQSSNGLASFANNTNSIDVNHGIINLINTVTGAVGNDARIMFSFRQVGSSSGLDPMASIGAIKEAGTSAAAIQFNTRSSDANYSEKVRIDSSGRLLVGTSTSSGNAGIQLHPNSLNCFQSINHVTGTASGEPYLFFNYNGSAIGNITQNGTTAVAYNTSSDYRLKENVAAVTDGIARLLQLKPSRFNFIADPDHIVDGFIAHEAQSVVPECVTGEKDAVDADGNPVYQGIDQSKLVPLLTAALQEAIAKIETLEARLTAAGIA